MSKLLDIMTAPWAITRPMLQEIGGIYLTHLRGEKINLEAIEAKLGSPLNNERRETKVIDGVAIIPAYGVIAKRMNLFSRISGGVSSEILGNEIRAAMDDPDVTAILLDIDSPGGTVDGTFELADGIYNARGSKPIVALANGLMASAAYAIGAAADRVMIVSDTTHVGSIGVVTTHTDYSQYQEKEGIKTEEIYAGKYKRIASQHKPLTDEGRDYLQAGVDYLYTLFVDRVATYRGVSAETVLNDMADGRIFIGQQAIDAGLVDGVSTLEDIVTSLSMGRLPEKQTSAVVLGAGAVRDADAENNDNINHEKVEDHDMDKTISVSAINCAYIEEKHPEIAAAFQEKGAEAGREQGATAERERIQGVLAHSMPGHEKLVEALAFDGKTSPDAAAAQVLKAEKENRQQTAKDITDDAKALGTITGTVDAGAGADDQTAGMSDEDKCKHIWDTNKDGVQAEFSSFGTFKAYYLNRDKVRRLGRTA